MNTTTRASIFERQLAKVATPRTQAYFQRNPKTGKHRGILEFVREDGVIEFRPERPVLGDTPEQIMQTLKQLAEGRPVSHGGVGEPWLAESNMPFDAAGNRVA